MVSTPRIENNSNSQFIYRSFVKIHLKSYHCPAVASIMWLRSLFSFGARLQRGPFSFPFGTFIVYGTLCSSYDLFLSWRYRFDDQKFSEILRLFFTQLQIRYTTTTRSLGEYIPPDTGRPQTIDPLLFIDLQLDLIFACQNIIQTYSCFYANILSYQSLIA